MHIARSDSGPRRQELAIQLGVAVAGIFAATSVILLGTVYPAASWLFLLIGVTLGATSARAARHPSLLRLTVATVSVALTPLVLIAL
ncbi:MAG: hypothetical protein ACE5F5_02110 [Acidimicrobiia bacterium]